MMDDKSPSTYEADFVVWTEEQARALRELAKHRALLPNALDLDNIIEEIETLGRSEFDAVESQILNIMIHLIKAASDPNAPAVPHWIVEIGAFHRAMFRKATPSMRARIDMARLWRLARAYASRELSVFGRTISPSLPAQCPYDATDFLEESIDDQALLARLAPPI